VSPAAQQEDWRRKYFDSIGAIEDEARQYRLQLQVLNQLAMRLCAAAQGQSPRLDDVLKRLREAVRREVGARELEPLSAAVAEEVRELDEARTRDAAAALPAAAVEQLVVSTAAPPATPGSAGGEHLCDVLLRLLAELRQEDALEKDVAAIDTVISPSLTREQLPGVVEKVGGLLIQRIRGLQKTCLGLEALLGQMLSQLDSLAGYVDGQGEQESLRHDSSDALDLQITGELRAMGASMDSGIDLTGLRRQLRERLTVIGQHLQGYRMREEERRRQSTERTTMMRAQISEMESKAKELQARLADEQRLAQLDTLTRIPNRLAWEQRVTEELAHWRRFRLPTCVAAWDIDSFKRINDSYGHRAGDKVLVVVAETLAAGIRGTDFVARYGGEEFVMLLPGMMIEDGQRIANQLREAIARVGFHFRGAPVSVTISCGITQLRDGDSASEAFDRADKAMYQAKEGGRNRVVVA
jgi:diguanylate cyclase